MLYSLSPSTTVCQLYFPLGGPPPIMPFGLLPAPPPPPPRSQPGYAVLTLVLPPDLSSLTIWGSDSSIHSLFHCFPGGLENTDKVQGNHGGRDWKMAEQFKVVEFIKFESTQPRLSTL